MAEDTKTVIEETVEDTVTCANCNATVDEDSAIQHGEEQYCEDCDSELFTVCEKCEETCLQENGRTVKVPNRRTYRGEEQFWCDSCVENYALKCDSCGGYAASDWTESDCNRTICRPCYEDNYTTCESCERIISYDDSYSYEDGPEGSYCSGCYTPDDEESEDNDGIKDYLYKPRAVFFPPKASDDKTTLYYGVELEVNTANGSLDSAVDHCQNTLSEHAYLKHDGSLSTGFEIVTHPHTLKAHRELWEPFFKRVPRGVTSYKGGECGLHVHVNRDALSAYLIGKILVFVNSENNKTFIEAIAQRTENTYCKIKDKKITDVRNDYGDRYEAVNLCNQRTIEFRIFRGNTRGDRFFKALEFVDSLIAWCRNASATQLRWQDYIKFVRTNRKEYGVLDTYLVEKGYLPAMKTAQRELMTVPVTEEN